MCIYSLHTGQRIEKAKVGEVLTRGEYRHHVALMGDDGELRCIRHGSTMQVEALRFDPQMMRQEDTVHQPDGSMIDSKQVLAWAGKAATVTLVRWHGHNHYAADALELPDGTIVHLSWIAEGVRMVRKRKLRKDAGTKRPRNLEKALGLDQLRAEPMAVIAIDPTMGETVKS